MTNNNKLICFLIQINRFLIHFQAMFYCCADVIVLYFMSHRARNNKIKDPRINCLHAMNHFQRFCYEVINIAAGHYSENKNAHNSVA